MAALRDVTFEGLGGAQTLRVAEAPREDAPIVAVAPALGMRASWYEELAAALVARGAHAALVEWPGLGTSPIRPGRGRDWGYAALLDHLAAARTAARTALPRASRFAWLGHSIGGTIALMDAGRSRAGDAGRSRAGDAGRSRAGDAGRSRVVDAVILVASGTPYLRSWDGRMRLQLFVASQIFPVAGRVLGYHDGRLGFGGREARTLMKEWSHLTRHGVWKVEGADLEAHLRACESPVLAVGLEGDDWAPSAATEHLLSKIGSHAIERCTWSSGLDHPHVRWPKRPAHAADLAVHFVERV